MTETPVDIFETTSLNRVLLIVPPYSGSDSNPPLGPGILARTVIEAGGECDVIDLNIQWINDVTAQGSDEHGRIGDHGKSRSRCAAAWRSLERAIGDVGADPEFVPTGGSAIAGCHFSPASVNAWAQRSMSDCSALSEWIQHRLSAVQVQPDLIGISIMGPEQVWCATLSSVLARREWPDVPIVVGGSHPTLLSSEVARDPAFGAHFDGFLVGHSEDELAALLRHRDDISTPNLVLVAGCDGPTANFSSERFYYEPVYREDWLGQFGDSLTLPVQFARGCAYGRCRYCTYPVVEPDVTRFDPARAVRAIDSLRLLHGVNKFSIKDSLVTVADLNAIADELVKCGVEIQWSATTKVAGGLVWSAARLAGAGLSTVELGVEAIHPNAQRAIDKVAPVSEIERVILAMTDAGVHVVVNLMFGLPGQSETQCIEQLDWADALLDRCGPEISFSTAMLEIERGSPFEMSPPRGIGLKGVAGWAHAYEWNTSSSFLRIADRLQDARARWDGVATRATLS